ncbi:hypothetical protein PHMEG_00019099 [Phytophthora megakarya]|uniref:Uncharacterized protein n=1 Tax=Phytophthora megakarya TaxID=4795 RepID=A0A225VUZ4_9STRA|nr:hypothetical protein PHMEG_00019099 [Phytophthora megakarya]
MEDFVCTAISCAKTDLRDDTDGMEYFHFVASWLLFIAVMIPFVADLLLVVNRDMRFTFDLVKMAVNEREFVSTAPIADEEIQ